jgi:hypothetical protein
MPERRGFWHRAGLLADWLHPHVNAVLNVIDEIRWGLVWIGLLLLALALLIAGRADAAPLPRPAAEVITETLTVDVSDPAAFVVQDGSDQYLVVDTVDGIVAIGRGAGVGATGDRFAAQGYFAGREAGDRFAAQGFYAGREAGSYFAAQGYFAGYQAGDRFIALGYESTRTDALSSPADITDSIAIGYQSDPRFNGHFLVKQANLNADPLIQGDLTSGNVKIGASTATAAGDFANTLDVMGDAGFSGNVVIGATSASAQLHVEQPSSTAAEPVLLLDQGNASEALTEYHLDGDQAGAVAMDWITSTTDAAYVIQLVSNGVLTDALTVTPSGLEVWGEPLAVTSTTSTPDAWEYLLPSGRVLEITTQVTFGQIAVIGLLTLNGALMIVGMVRDNHV